MDLIKWTKNIKPKFPNVVEKFFGKKIDDQASGSEEIASVPAVNINVGGNAKTIYQTGKHATHNTEIIDQLK